MSSSSANEARTRELADAFGAKFDVQTITARSVLERRNERDDGRRMVLVDVRAEDERAVSVIEGAMSVEEYERARTTLGAHDCVCYCTIGYRSGQYAEKMSKAKKADEDVEFLNLYGSIVAYTHEGGELVDPATGEKTKRVHTFGKEWSCVADGYEAVFYKSALVGGLGQMFKGLFKRKK
ncbi:Rhodanese-like domain [Ostreococcus tauri]|uniref:Putative MPT-synthase sulfurylase n=1 Tax=Ostreococcus tauri TaxID=70448 RepID=Q01GT9_OSTTA|nr:Rhodanese-like domain [Ostreococcus tauri]OUS42823.1 putative MPT-synthase sulfurylase [Ostreococcus tauri]CAL50055.1 Rhodanese-like domain [Ostreococcus tauri]|eukprot:XP_003074203.1 Rhodanese-like domain [Ostreococcus tauri]